jgi:hypothetical protein
VHESARNTTKHYPASHSMACCSCTPMCAVCCVTDSASPHACTQRKRAFLIDAQNQAARCQQWQTLYTRAWGTHMPIVTLQSSVSTALRTHNCSSTSCSSLCAVAYSLVVNQHQTTSPPATVARTAVADAIAWQQGITQRTSFLRSPASLRALGITHPGLYPDGHRHTGGTSGYPGTS